MATPEWLNQDYMAEVLKLHHKDVTLKIQKLQMTSPFGKGDNYGGVMTKVNVLYTIENGCKTKEKFLLIKSSYENDQFAKEKMAPYDIFNREMSIYDQILPKLNELLREINDADKLFPTILYCDYKRQALIFEDLSVQGYTMADRIRRLDMDHANLILRKLAKMHATSAVLNERQPGCLESYDKGFFNKYTDTYKTFFVNTFMACAEYLQKNSDTQYYARKIFAMKPYYMKLGTRCFEATPEHINVLNHGDVWTNNVMFKYDPVTKQPIDVLLIDFQYTFWGAPTLDLHYFINTSLKDSVRRYQEDELFQKYHYYFKDTLKKLRYSSNPIPSLKMLNFQAEENRFFALHSALVIQPLMINEDPTDSDYNALMGEDERAFNFKKSLYTNPIVQENLRVLLPYFDQKGLLDIDQ